MTSFAVITDESEHVKVPLVSADMVPEVAILDARTVVTAPPHVTADTGMGVCTHAIEAYLSTDHSDFTDAMAEKAIQLVCQWLPLCYRDGGNANARQRMHNTSCLVGMAFENVGLGITHSLAHALGGRFPIAHGRLNAILLPHTLAFNTTSGAQGESTSRIAWLGHLVGSTGPTERQQAYAFVQAVQRLARDLQIGPRITDHGIDRTEFRTLVPELAAAALEDGCTATNPVRVTHRDLEAILLKLL